jgi:hypothetical protein
MAVLAQPPRTMADRALKTKAERDSMAFSWRMVGTEMPMGYQLTKPGAERSSCHHLSL